MATDEHGAADGDDAAVADGSSAAVADGAAAVGDSPAEAAISRAVDQLADGAAAAATADGAAAAAAADGAAAAAAADGATACERSATAAAPADGDAAAEAGVTAAAGSAGGATTAPHGAADTKKRGRRRRRKPQDGEAAPGAAEQTSSAGSRVRKRPARIERPAFNVGDDVFGRVLELTPEAIFIEVGGGKAQGLFDRELLIQIPPHVGEQFIAKVISVSLRGGLLILGREEWDTTQSRAALRAALESKQTIDCWVTGVIRGGVEVDYQGVRAFAPASHVELRPGADLSALLGKKLPFVVTSYGKRGRDVVVSRKEMLEAAYLEKRKEQLAKLEAGMRCKAVIRTVLAWGAFASLPDFDDIEGVIHMSEASHARGARLTELLETGAEIEVEVLRIDDKGKLWLSRKAALDDPWEKAAAKYPVGSLLTGKVVRLTDFGAFVQIEPGIDGLCHVSDLSYLPVTHPSEVVSEGQPFEVIVAHIDPAARRVTLHPAPPTEEREAPFIKRLMQHQKVDAVVMQIRERGLGVRIIGATGRRARAFVPAVHTGTARGADLRKSFPLGRRIEAKVIDADTRRGEPRLSIRALKQDAEKKAYREYRKQVQRESGFGTFADLLKDKL